MRFSDERMVATALIERMMRHFVYRQSKEIKRLHMKPKRICTVAQFSNVSSQAEIAYCISEWQL